MKNVRIFAAIIAATLTLSTTAKAANLVEIASNDDRLSTLVAAISAAGLNEKLRGPGPFTVYAPNNAAFDGLPGGILPALLLPENMGQLADILLYHVDDRNLSAEAFPEGPTRFKPILTSMRLCVTKADGGISIADGTGDTANIVVADIKADNGVIHMIDKVLVPGTRPACG